MVFRSRPLDAILHRQKASWLELFINSPVHTLAKTLKSYRLVASPKPQSPPIVVVCISDTHNTQAAIPPGDLLIHAGDLTQSGTLSELQATIDWIKRQPHIHKVVIAGNHDKLLDSSLSKEEDESRAALDWGDIHYLENNCVTLDFEGGRGLKVYGSPWTRKYGPWAFQFPVDANYFDGKIPDDVDVLVTHSPPRFRLDGANLGDLSLLREVWRVKPLIHVFGHIHVGYGTENVVFDRFDTLYEGVMRGKYGVAALLDMARLLIWERMGIENATNAQTTLINAATVGGFRDDIVRKAVVVNV